MSDFASERLDDIRSMMSSGHRNVRFERHSLVLWGLAGALLTAFSSTVFTPEQIPSNQLRAIAWLVLLTVVLGAVGVADWQLMRRAKQARDETWSFLHRQIIKVWWLLMTTGTLLTFATFFYGGGELLFPAWLVLLGIGLYVHGLFSEEILEWIGGLIILMGVACGVTHVPAPTMKWIDASVLGIGFPLLAVMLDRGRARSTLQRGAQTFAWAVAVLALPVALIRLAPSAIVLDAPVISLQQFRSERAFDGPRAVALPAGTVIPVIAQVSADLFDSMADQTMLALTLAQPVEVLMADGQMNAVRRPGGRWALRPQGPWLVIPSVRAELTAEHGPVVRTRLILDLMSGTLR